MPKKRVINRKKHLRGAAFLEAVGENQLYYNRQRAAKQLQVSLGENHAALRAGLDKMIADHLNPIMQDGETVTRAQFFQRMAAGYLAEPETAVALLESIVLLEVTELSKPDDPGSGSRQLKVGLGRHHQELREALQGLFAAVQSSTGLGRSSIVQQLALASVQMPEVVAVLAKELISLKVSNEGEEE